MKPHKATHKAICSHLLEYIMEDTYNFIYVSKARYRVYIQYIYTFYSLCVLMQNQKQNQNKNKINAKSKT